eukprot:Gregarina_sp_Poly_1__10756@NODE_821_length_6140_cov_16_345299_g594_i0_p1_GENE_NODE_821_length_6140_cov_16_345299_g594_i0NODE_821_length_6140_cov_16_345299_g594_i0_p1_ORF_typecomplete_len196_score6_73_NODE_821_length_6140_cov_16_345299_g594_i015962183
MRVTRLLDNFVFEDDPILADSIPASVSAHSVPPKQQNEQVMMFHPASEAAERTDLVKRTRRNWRVANPAQRPSSYSRLSPLEINGCWRLPQTNRRTRKSSQDHPSVPRSFRRFTKKSKSKPQSSFRSQFSKAGSVAARKESTRQEQLMGLDTNTFGSTYAHPILSSSLDPQFDHCFRTFKFNCRNAFVNHAPDPR